MQLSLFDLHCDTAYQMYTRGLSLSSVLLAASPSHASHYRCCVQVMALWTPPTLSDGDGWRQLLAVYENLKKDPLLRSGAALLTDTVPVSPLVPILLLSVEDARILEGDLSRILELRRMGVRIITPLWSGCSIIGGAHDTDRGLTAFGRAAIQCMLSCGIIPDVSHASRASTHEIFEIAQSASLPVIASHSNAYSVTPVSRNLTDHEVREICRLDGLIGINLHQAFLTEKETATVEDVVAHVEHFLSLGAARALCLGCDLDGADVPPTLGDTSKLPLIAEALFKRNYSEAFVRDLFFENANRFAKNYMKV